MLARFCNLFSKSLNIGNHGQVSMKIRQMQTLSDKINSSVKFKPIELATANFNFSHPNLLKIQNPGRKPSLDPIFELPIKPGIIYNDIINPDKTVDDPKKIIEQKAARLIVIRRRKMKRHKLKKLRIRMKFEWAKVRQRREMRKEKAFQAELMSQIKEAKKFNPESYASEKLQKANEVVVPVRWKGKLYPDFIINELITRKEKKMLTLSEREKRRKLVNLNPSYYKY